MPFAALVLDFWTSVWIMFLLFLYGLIQVGKKLASDEDVRKSIVALLQKWAGRK